VASQLVASRVVLSSIELVSYLVIIIVIITFLCSITGHCVHEPESK
jgi:hypothetical protein